MDTEEIQRMASKAKADGWEVFEHFSSAGLMDGAAVLKGTEFHCQLSDGFRMSRKDMREFLRPLFERHGFLTTRVVHEDVANQRFNRAFGFEKTWSDERFHYYILTALPFERSGKCQ